MSDLIAFVRARLDEWEAGTVDDPRKDDGGRCEYLLGWHMEPGEMRRIVDAGRKLLAAYAQVAHMDIADPEPEYAYGRAVGLGEAVRMLAAAWSGHADYREEWKP